MPYTAKSRETPRWLAVLSDVLPLAERIETVPDPNIVRNSFGERELLHQVFIGQRIMALIVREFHAFQAFANDARDKRDRSDGWKRALKLPRHLRGLDRTCGRYHRD